MKFNLNTFLFTTFYLLSFTGFSQVDVTFKVDMQYQNISENGKEGWVTNVIDKISDSFYQNSLSSMIGLQSFLESQDIPYFTFWGWTQFDNELKQKFRPYLDLLYNKNWWKPNKSMSEYITDRYGENGLMGNGDFHPNSGCQRYFYETIIKKLLEPELI